MKRFLALMSRPAVIFSRRSKSLFAATTAINALVLLPFLQACTIAPVQTSSVLPVLEGSSKAGRGAAKNGETDLLTTASAAFAKGQPIAKSLASLAADTPDFAPPGAGSTGNVDPATGKLTFGVPLAGIGGGTTPSFTLGLSYSSASVYETAINWNYEQVPGEVGLGWSLPAAHMRIARLPGSTGVAYDDSFMLMTGTAGYRLALVGYDQSSNVKYYETNDGDFARLEFHDNSAGDPGSPESSSYWVLTDATGIKYYYGWAYRAQDGASSTDADFASFCTDLESGPIFQAAADDCEFGPAELDVRWGSWTGVSYDTVNQEQFASSWYLSAIENINGLRTTLYYGRHTQQVGQQKMSDPERTAVPKTFGKGTYLYKVVTDDGSQMTLDWASRTATEILDPRQYNSEPDGYQEKYQALYLSQVDTFDGGIAAPNGGWATAPTPVSQAALGYNNGVLLGFDNPEQLMGKRILTAVTPSEYNFTKAADGDAAPFDPQPSYSFAYWGQNTVQQTENGATLSNDDGVSVSRWNDDQGFNGHKGALYGLIKSVTSPLGATTTYQYTNAQGTLVQRTLEVDDLAPYTEVNANRHAYVGSGYVLLSTDVTAPGSTDVHNGFFIFAWTSTGWQRVVSEVSRGYYSGFTLQSDMDTNAAVLAIDMSYDGSGRRISRTVSNPASAATSSTDYWYGSGIDPLVIVRDGISYRLIQGILIEQRTGDAAPVAQYYVFNDHLGSVRMVTDAAGEVVESIGYDGDWGRTRIEGQASVTSYDSMSALWRFQGREEDTFPLSRLGIDDAALAGWLDDLQLYHFHYREYAAGFAAFLSIDPAGQDASPYMAFGDNPANAVDPDGGWWEPALQIFVFSAAWGAFFAASEGFGSGLAGLIFSAIVVGGGRQVARYVEQTYSLMVARVETVSFQSKEFIVVARPEYYERAAMGVKPVARVLLNVKNNLYAESFENLILAGTYLTQAYRDAPKSSIFGAMVVVGLLTPLLYIGEMKSFGGRGTVWTVVKGFKLEGNRPQSYWAERAYAFQAWDWRFGAFDSLGQLITRIAGAAALSHAPASFQTAYNYLAGYASRNAGGRAISGTMQECADGGCRTPTESKKQYRAIYLTDQNQLTIQFYSIFGDTPPQPVTENTDREVLEKIFGKFDSSVLIRNRNSSMLPQDSHNSSNENDNVNLRLVPIDSLNDRDGKILLSRETIDEH